MQIKRLDHFGIEVRDLQRSERFYQDVLGLKLHSRLGHFTQFQAGNAMLALFRNPDMHPMGGGDLSNPLGKGHWAFEISYADLQDTLDRFQKEGARFHGPVDWGDHDCLYFLDPDGNLLEVVAYRPE